jgi:restriction system protein
LGGWAGWLIPIASVVLIGVPISLYLQRIRLPREETAAGVAALAGMRWRDFIHLVLDALIRRGYERTFEPQAAGDEGDYILERDGQRYLLSSKHGAAYVLGSTAIAEFANTIRMRGAAGGLLVTSGQFAPEAKPLAAAQRIELLDGPALWPELRPLLPQEQRATIAAPAQGRAKRHVAMAWLGSAVAGVLLFSVLHQSVPQTDVVAESTAPASHAAAMTVPQQAPFIKRAPIPTDPRQLEKRRNDVAQAISTLPNVDRAVWSSQSTLLVYLLDESGEPKHSLCPLLERYEELAASRVQLEPPPGSTRPVRFVQCRAF